MGEIPPHPPTGLKLPFAAGANASERIRAAQKDRHPRHQQYKLSDFLMQLWLKASRSDITCLQVGHLRDAYWSRRSSRRLNRRLQLLCESFPGDLHGRVTLGPQLMPNVLKGAAAARPCKLKGAFQVRGALVHRVELSTIERRGVTRRRICRERRSRLTKRPLRGCGLSLAQPYGMAQLSVVARRPEDGSPSPRPPDSGWGFPLR
jgi:hypothetical protein